MDIGSLNLLLRQYHFAKKFLYICKQDFKILNKDRLYYLSFLAVMLILSLVIIAGPEVIFVRQLSDYAIHIMMIFFILGFLFLFLSKPKSMFVSFASCAALCVFIKNESNTDFVLPKENSSQKCQVGHFNLSNIDDLSQFFISLEKDNYDVVSFQEFTPEWRGALNKELKKRFPYSIESVRLDPHGKAIYSVFPIEIKDTLSKDFALDLVLNVKKHYSNYTLITTYLTPSLDNNSLVLARLQMKNISDYIRNVKDKIIVIGDFNMVYWNKEIKQFRVTTKLNNGRKDVIPVNLNVPYDQVFYSTNLQCIGVKDVLLKSDQRVGIISTFQDNLLANTKTIKSIF
jgi:hypothetical protein